MKRIGTLITAALIGLAIPGLAHADGQTIDVTTDCAAGLTIVTSGFPEGATGFYAIGSEPPRLLVLNTVVHADWPSNGDLDGIWHYMANTDPGMPDQMIRVGDLACADAMIAPEPAAPAEIGNVDVDHNATPSGNDVQYVLGVDPEPDFGHLWVDVRLAPPW